MRSLACLVVLLLAIQQSQACRRLHQDAPTDLRSKLLNFGALPPENQTSGASGPILTLGEELMNRIIANTRSGLESIEDLSNVLTTDADLWVDQRNEGLVQICSALESTNATGADNSTAATSKEDLLAEAAAAGLTPQQVVLSRSSRPQARAKIVLDVDGHAITGTVWNSLTQKTTIVVPPFDTDGNPSSFSADELAAIDNIWRIVAEDYAPFDVDVTFTDPGDAYLGQGNGVRACIGGDSDKLIGGQMGGVSRIGEFGKGPPCFVFAENLQHSAKHCGDAASHEIGHTLGLYHDGATTGETYYEGQGNWAPIMGKSYSANVAQFSKGEYQNANQKQDDLQVIQNHLDLIPPPVNLARSSAALLGPGGFAQGIIARRKQTDFYKFAARAGPATITATGAGSVQGVFATKQYNIGNLDMVLTLYDDSGRVLQRSNPPGASSDAMGGSITTNLPDTGMYYVSVGATGAGDPLLDGYSDYGSLGAYSLQASFTPTSDNPGGGGGSGVGGTLSVARIKLHRFSDGFPLNNIRCKAAVSVKALSKGLAKSEAVPAVKVTVTGRFYSSAGDSSFDRQVSGFTTRKGVVVFTSRPTVENECIFEVLDAVSLGYQYTPSAKHSLVLQKMNW